MNSEKQTFDITQFTAIGRPLDPEHFPNLLAMILTPVAGVVGALVIFFTQGGFSEGVVDGLMTAVRAGFFTAAAAFVAWAIAREIDPDHDYSAFLAMALAVLAMLVLDAPAIGLISSAVVLISSRVVNRIVGPPAKIADAGQLLFLGLLVAAFDNWILVVIVAMAFLLDGVLKNPKRIHLGFALAAIGILVGRVVLLGYDQFDVLTAPYVALMILISILFFAAIVATRTITSNCDVPKYELHLVRVRAAMILVLAAGLISALWNGNTGMVWMLPLWASMLGVAFWRFPKTIREIRAARNS